MKRESVVFLVAGTFFGLLVGWILGSQQVKAPTASAAAAPASTSAAPATDATTSSAAPAPPLDTQQVAALQQQATAQPSNADVREQLGDLYFNAERFSQAVPWYEAALKLAPKNVNASTDLGVCYYYTNQVDRALSQFDYSLSVDPKHVKTLFNQGIVRAFGKQDFQGAQQSWEKVVAIAPQSVEGKQAQQALDGLRAGGHTGGGASAPTRGTGASSE